MKLSWDITGSGLVWNADFNCSSGPGLITGYSGHRTAYGFGFRAHLRSLAG